VQVIEVTVATFRYVKFSQPIRLAGHVGQFPGGVLQCTVAVVWTALMQRDRNQCVGRGAPQHFRSFHHLASGEFNICFFQ